MDINGLLMDINGLLLIGQWIINPTNMGFTWDLFNPGVYLNLGLLLYNRSFKPRMYNPGIYLTNGNFRIRKWSYCTIFDAIFCGNIPLHRPKK